MRSELLRSVYVQRGFCKYRNWSLLAFFCTNWRSLDYFTLSVSCVAVVVAVVVRFFLDDLKVKQNDQRLLRWRERADVDGGAGRSAVGRDAAASPDLAVQIRPTLATNRASTFRRRLAAAPRCACAAAGTFELRDSFSFPSLM